MRRIVSLLLLALPLVVLAGSAAPTCPTCHIW